MFLGQLAPNPASTAASGQCSTDTNLTGTQPSLRQRDGQHAQSRTSHGEGALASRGPSCFLTSADLSETIRLEIQEDRVDFLQKE